MVYAIIYSLFLGFGILVGSVLLGENFPPVSCSNVRTLTLSSPGMMYPQAQTSVTCDVPYWWDDSRIPARHVSVPLTPTRAPGISRSIATDTLIDLRPFHMGAALRHLSSHHQSSEMDPDPRHDPYRLLWLSSQLLDLNKTRPQYPGVECDWGIRDRYDGQPVLEMAAWIGCCGYVAGNLRHGAVW